MTIEIITLRGAVGLALIVGCGSAVLVWREEPGDFMLACVGFIGGMFWGFVTVAVIWLIAFVLGVVP